MWLEETLKNFKRILLLVSHSQDFMVRPSCWLLFSGRKGQADTRFHCHDAQSCFFKSPTLISIARANSYSQAGCSRPHCVFC